MNDAARASVKSRLRLDVFAGRAYALVRRQRRVMKKLTGVWSEVSAEEIRVIRDGSVADFRGLIARRARSLRRQARG